ncbi:MAG: phosphoribosylformylglycinamidine synthase subunit PurS [Deltaproteobacteria bacterium]|nr:phosphoribosylformylglycinamidine synthase subunit PurS [Deltaproteobacteria bacterium]
MPARLEIRLKPDLIDAEGLAIARKASAYFGLPVTDTRVIRVLVIDAPLTAEQLERVRIDLFTNPVIEESSFSPLADNFDWLIWVGLRPGVRDPAGSTAVEAIEDLLGIQFSPNESVYTSRIYEIRGDLEKPDVETIAREILANNIIQQWRLYRKSGRHARPHGDPPGIARLQPRRTGAGGDNWDGKEGIGIIIPRVVLENRPQVRTFSIESDDVLQRLSMDRSLALHPSDIPVIRKYFLDKGVRAKRKSVGLDLPTDVELEFISQARSDHCNHNTFKGLFRYLDRSTGREETVDNPFKTCIEDPTLSIKEKKDWVISVLWDNAGVGRFDEHYYYVITGETHNSPSNMEAYGGAITGIVGIYRDPLGTGRGSKLIMGTYGFCVGPRDYDGELKPHLHPRRLLDGLIEGVRDGGNKSGIPTPYGQVLFDHSYMGKCLVFVTAMGIMPATISGTSSHLKTTHPGDLIIMCGGRVGKDGIHGVTAASETYSETTPAGHVQIGDPYTQKKMHDFLIEARDDELIEFITDNGGGGLSSSVGESARWSNGCRVELAKVPLKYEGLDPWEIWVSESQERMTVAVKPEKAERFMELSKKHAVESTVIGQYTDTGFLHLTFDGTTCAYVQMDLLKSSFPQWEFDAEWLPPASRGLTEPVWDEPEDHGTLLKSLLKRPNISDKSWVQRQYDHEVQGGSIIKPLVGKERDMASDAVVVRPVLDSLKGIALTQAINPFYSLIDTYHMTAVTIDEAVRRLIAVGGDPSLIGGVDNFCWPTIIYDPIRNPDGKYKAAQLVRACWALRDYTLAFEIPLLSGKDSMYTDGQVKGPYGISQKISGLPTLQFTATTLVNDIRKCVTMDLKAPGDLVYLLGDTRDELGAGEFYQMMGWVGLNVPTVSAETVTPLYHVLYRAIKEGLIASCHTLGRGGLGVHLALCAIGGNLGMDIDLRAVPVQGRLSNTRLLCSESAGRFIVTIDPRNKDAFEHLITGMDYACVGKVNAHGSLTISGVEGKIIILETVDDLRSAWKEPFGDLI